MTGQRRALIVATERYDAPSFTQLAAPAHDARALHGVLSDPTVGDFQVTVLRNPTAQEARLAIESFFIEVKREDLLLLHFSCHGVKNPEGELYLAMRDTVPNRLAATGLPADFVNRLMATSRAQQIALFLDCCFGGAFDRGMRPRASGSVNVKDAFQRQETVRSGRARVVVAAAGDVQYALEGSTVVDRRDQPSVFTGVVIEALSSGKADRDRDGWVGIYELFDYVCDHVAEVTTAQTPELSTFGTHGDMLLARCQAGGTEPTPLEEELAALLKSPLTTARLQGIAELASRVVDLDVAQAAAAWRELERRSTDDASAAVRGAAAEALATATFRVPVGPIELDDDGRAVVVVDGPPLARQVRAVSGAAWLAVVSEAGRVLLSVQEGWEPAGAATLTVTGPTGSATVEILAPRVTAAPPPPPVPPPSTTTRRGRGRPWRRVVIVGGVVAALVATVVTGLVVWILDPKPTLPQGARLPDDAILWVRAVDGADEIFVGDLDDRDPTLLPVEGEPKVPTLTADRRTVLYASDKGRKADEEGRKGDTVWAAGTGGEQPQPILDDDSCPSVGRLSVSPDGTMIAVPCRADLDGDTNKKGIRVYSIDGTLLRILASEHEATAPTWTADGHWIIYSRRTTGEIRDDERGGHLFAVAADDEHAEPVPLTTTADVQDDLAVVTPDQRAVVFVRSTGADSDDKLYWLDLDVDDTSIGPQGDARMIMAAGEPVSGTQPVVSPDGDVLLYLAGRTALSLPLASTVPEPPEPELSQVRRIAWERR